jgi:hypothetical protein
MKKCAVLLVMLAFVFGQHEAFAQADSGFTEEGIGIKAATVATTTATGTGVSQSLYHLLIIDRTVAVGEDISGVAKDALLYKAKHGQTGYLIALYKVSGGQNAVLPSNAYIVLDLVTNRKSTVGEFLSSALIKTFVTEPIVLTHLQEALTLDK